MGVATVGLFGGAKVVWLREASFFLRSPCPASLKQVKEAVARLTEEIKRGLLPGQRLLITAAKVHRGYAFYKACVRRPGAVVEYDLADKPKEMAGAGPGHGAGIARARKSSRRPRRPCIQVTRGPGGLRHPAAGAGGGASSPPTSATVAN
jgi:hypothetical protein